MVMRKLTAGLGVALLAGMASVQPASAVQLNFDLDDGTIFGDGTVGNPFNYSSNGIDLGGPMQVDPGQSLEIWIDFFDRETGLKQHLQVTDEGDPLDESFGVSASGTSIPNGTPTFNVVFTGVKGSLLPNNDFTSNTGNCDNNNCVSATFPVDLTDTSFLFHDIHIIFTPPPSSAPAIVTTVQFGVALDSRAALEIGVWPLSEPGVMALFGFGLLGFAGMAWRNGGLRAVRTR